MSRVSTTARHDAGTRAHLGRANVVAKIPSAWWVCCTNSRNLIFRSNSIILQQTGSIQQKSPHDRSSCVVSGSACLFLRDFFILVLPLGPVRHWTSVKNKLLQIKTPKCSATLTTIPLLVGADTNLTNMMRFYSKKKKLYISPSNNTFRSLEFEKTICNFFSPKKKVWNFFHFHHLK